MRIILKAQLKNAGVAEPGQMRGSWQTQICLRETQEKNKI